MKSQAIIILAFIMLLPSALSSQADPGAQTLANGLRIVVRERHTAPLVAIDLFVRAGSADELPGENGCAHFLEHTLFKGTTTRAVGRADYDIENLGGELNASTGADYAHYCTELPASQMSAAMNVIADIVRNATFPDAEIERERAVILDELARHTEDTPANLTDRLYTKAFAGKPYSLSPGGQPESIRIRARDTLAAFFRRLYIPSRCTLSVAGDVTADTVKVAALAAFGDWIGEDKPIAAVEGASRITAGPEPGRSVRATVAIAFPAPAARNGQLARLAKVCAALLGSQSEGGRFGMPQWSGTQVAVRFTPRREAGLMTITAAMPEPLPPKPFEQAPAPPFASVSALELAMRQIVATLSTNPPRSEELSAAVNVVRGQIIYDLETDAGLARTAGLADLLGAESPERELAALDNVRPSDIQRYAAAWLISSRAIAVRTSAARSERQQ